MSKPDQAMQNDPPPEHIPVRRLPGPQAAIEPCYPVSRLIKGNLLEPVRTLEQLECEKRQTQNAIQQIRKSFEAEMAELRRETEAQLEALRLQAEAEGRQQGLQQALAVIEQAKIEVGRMREQAVEGTKELAFALARTILDVEFRVRPEAIVDLVRGVLAKARFRQRIVVVVHPDALEYLRAEIKRLAEEMPFVETLEVRVDQSLPTKGVRIETEMGTYEGGLDLQLERLREQWVKNAT